MTSRSNSLHSDLPKYTVKVSQRAKCVRLSLSVEDGLEVVVPANYDQLKIPELVRKKMDWIDRNQRKLDEREAFFILKLPMSCLTRSICDRRVRNGKSNINKLQRGQVSFVSKRKKSHFD